MDDFTTFENVDAARRRYARDCVAALASGRMASDQVNKVSNPFSPIFMAREAEEGIAGPQYGRVDNEELRRWPQDEMGLICNFIKLFKCTRNWECWERHNDGDAVVVLFQGHATLVIEVSADSEEEMRMEMQANSLVIVPCGVWFRVEIQGTNELNTIAVVKSTQEIEYRDV